MNSQVAIPKKVGRVVTSYGHWKWIARWLDDETLLQPFVEWIFINDKPSDPVPEALRAMLARFGRVIEPRANMGRCCARNYGVNLLNTEWIDIVDGDDFPLPLDEGFDLSATGCAFIYFEVGHHRENEAGTVVKELDLNWSPPPLLQLIESLVGNCDCRPVAVMWRREAFIGLGGFDGRSDYVEDLNLCIRARLAGLAYSKSKERKASYQRGSAGRTEPPIVAVANLWNWELARPLVKPEFKAALDEQIAFYRKAILWAGMREMEKGATGIGTKMIECAKWLLGRHRR